VRSEVLKLMTAMEPPEDTDTRVTRLGNDIVRLEIPREARFDTYWLRTRLLYRRHPRLKLFMLAVNGLLVFMTALALFSWFRMLPRIGGSYLMLVPLWLLGLALKTMFLRRYFFAPVIELRPRGILFDPGDGEPMEVLMDAAEIGRVGFDEQYGILELVEVGERAYRGWFRVPTGVLIPTGLWGRRNGAWFMTQLGPYIREYWGPRR
jgi:hypothetical protein